MKKIIKWLIIIGIIFFLSWGIYVFGKYIVFPSYLSVKYSCTNMSVKELEEEFGYTLTGTFDPETSKIILYEDDPSVLAHEECHAQQQAEERLDNCDNQIGLFFDEIECYIKQYF